MAVREGNLSAPERQPLGWQEPAFLDKDKLYDELERVFDICHGCRRCVNLCDAFPTLFDLVDESDTLEVDGVDKADYMKVVDQCFLCDLCAQTKCPYLPPHEWKVDFPHLMLRAKAFKFREGDTKWRDRLITSTDPIFDLLSVPGINRVANAAAKNDTLRELGRKYAGIHPKAPLPPFEAKTVSRWQPTHSGTGLAPRATERTTGKVAIYVTCYGDHNEPKVVEDLVAVLNHNGVPVKLLKDARCCGMPKLELGDLAKVQALKDANMPVFLDAIRDGYDIIAPVPSCVLMYKQELPLMFPDDADVARVKAAFFDPFEYLMLRHRDGLIRTDFQRGLGKVAYHVACHQRVQNFGMKTRDFLQLIPDTEVTAIERCSGHDGTYAVKEETYDKAMKIVRPVARKVIESGADTMGSDCPMAGRLIAHGVDVASSDAHREAEHPASMVRRAYGI
ncbi:MAG: Fe-S oxidoreductase [Pseudomonadales bacterium]|nr:Fe-S oxidoreductase [Pseudomonadales bacterium]MCP5184666.1 Fe-S oxidoreductase [Pseudomonadales bacterium]